MRKPNSKDQRASSSMDGDRQTQRNSLRKVLNNREEREAGGGEGRREQEQREESQSWAETEEAAVAGH